LNSTRTETSQSLCVETLWLLAILIVKALRQVDIVSISAITDLPRRPGDRPSSSRSLITT